MGSLFNKIHCRSRLVLYHSSPCRFCCLLPASYLYHSSPCRFCCLPPASSFFLHLEWTFCATLLLHYWSACQLTQHSLWISLLTLHTPPESSFLLRSSLPDLHQPFCQTKLSFYNKNSLDSSNTFSLSLFLAFLSWKWFENWRERPQVSCRRALACHNYRPWDSCAAWRRIYWKGSLDRTPASPTHHLSRPRSWRRKHGSLYAHEEPPGCASLSWLSIQAFPNCLNSCPERAANFNMDFRYSQSWRLPVTILGGISCRPHILCIAYTHVTILEIRAWDTATKFSRDSWSCCCRSAISDALWLWGIHVS